MESTTNKLDRVGNALEHMHGAGWELSKEDKGTAWHYTAGTAACEIVRSGQLHASSDGLIWFSLNEHWEKTAKAARENDLNPLQLLRRGIVPFRFGMSTLKLCPFSGRREDLAALQSVLRYGLDAYLLAKLWTAVGIQMQLNTVQSEAAKSFADPEGYTLALRERGERYAKENYYILNQQSIALSNVEQIERFDHETGWTNCRELLLSGKEFIVNALCNGEWNPYVVDPFLDPENLVNWACDPESKPYNRGRFGELRQV